jgi:hypothetical protein
MHFDSLDDVAAFNLEMQQRANNLLTRGFGDNPLSRKVNEMNTATEERASELLKRVDG